MYIPSAIALHATSVRTHTGKSSELVVDLPLRLAAELCVGSVSVMALVVAQLESEHSIMRKHINVEPCGHPVLLVLYYSCTVGRASDLCTGEDE